MRSKIVYYDLENENKLLKHTHERSRWGGNPQRTKNNGKENIYTNHNSKK